MAQAGYEGIESPLDEELRGMNLFLVPKRPRMEIAQPRFRWSTLGVESVPCYLQKQYISEFYRPTLSFQDAILSVFSFHNETINIWTHLVGAISMKTKLSAK